MVFGRGGGWRARARLSTLSLSRGGVLRGARTAPRATVPWLSRPPLHLPHRGRPSVIFVSLLSVAGAAGDCSARAGRARASPRRVRGRPSPGRPAHGACERSRASGVSEVGLYKSGARKPRAHNRRGAPCRAHPLLPPAATMAPILRSLALCALLAVNVFAATEVGAAKGSGAPVQRAKATSGRALGRASALPPLGTPFKWSTPTMANYISCLPFGGGGGPGCRRGHSPWGPRPHPGGRARGCRPPPVLPFPLYPALLQRRHNGLWRLQQRPGWGARGAGGGWRGKEKKQTKKTQRTD